MSTCSTELALTAYDLARDPKQLELIDGDHFVPYSGAAMEHTAIVMRDFLLEHL